jgi:hypothetical protein
MAWKKIITSGEITPYDLKEGGFTGEDIAGQSGEALILNFDGSLWSFGTGRAAGSQFLTSDVALSGSSDPFQGGQTAEDGDLHISGTSGDMYQWDGTDWNFVVNLSGPQGDDGDSVIGADGADGPQGPTGDVGPQGDDGADGADGPQGNEGNSITQVVLESSSDDGATYEIKTTDYAGQNLTTIGSFFVKTGDTGIQGDQGDVGPQGDAGPQGVTGDQGEIGLQGNVGPQGVTGEDGAQGGVGNDGLTFTPNALTWDTPSSTLEVSWTDGAGSTEITSAPVEIDSTSSDNFFIGGASGFQLSANNDGSMSVMDPAGQAAVDILVGDVHLGSGGVTITAGGIVEVADAFQAVNADSVTAAATGATATELLPSDMLGMKVGYKVYRGAIDISDQGTIDASIAATSDLYWSEDKGYWGVQIPLLTGGDADSATNGAEAASVNYDLHMSLRASDGAVTPYGASGADVIALNRLNNGAFFIGNDDSIWVKTA